jgi:tetratricopeptide (TPR) repeat protein
MRRHRKRSDREADALRGLRATGIRARGFRSCACRGLGHRRLTMLLLGSAVAVALALASLVGGVLAEPSSSLPATAPSALRDGAPSGPGGSRAIGDLEAAVRAAPDPKTLTQLGFAYQQRWRETADASFLPRSATALRRALRLDPGNGNAVLGLGSLALIRHEFRAALSYGRRAQRLLVGSGRPQGLIGDALVELGRYEKAFRAFELMVTRLPGLASYARVAYARELTGDPEGARAAMRLALAAAAGRESTAWAHVELAKLELGLGRVGVASREARRALRAFPGYPAARIALARAKAARGRLDHAVGQAQRAAEAVPTVESVALLSDLLDRAGRRADARQQRQTVAILEKLLGANGVQVDLESAVYRADRRIRPAETVRLARRAREARPSIYGDDALAWALARAGRCAEALPLAERALRLGTRDPLFYFHRGYAEGCAGNRAAMREWYARALEQSEAFSVRWAPVARAAIRS